MWKIENYMRMVGARPLETGLLGLYMVYAGGDMCTCRFIDHQLVRVPPVVAE